uniref:Uncharacterized protein n=1 Tax=Oryza brachyantha TaxID=4533 RepID=J3NAQ5_ORYBR
MIARSSLFLQNQIFHIFVPCPNDPFHFLGPVGNTYPTDMICLEAKRIPFKNAQLNTSD